MRDTLMPVPMSDRWFVKFPLDAYALGPITFPRLVSEKEVRQYARKMEGVVRLPRGFSCWIA